MQEMQEMWVWSLGQKDSLEKKMETLSSILAWEIHWTEKPGGLQSTGLQSQTRLSDCTQAYLNFKIPICVFFYQEGFGRIKSLVIEEGKLCLL